MKKIVHFYSLQKRKKTSTKENNFEYSVKTMANPKNTR